MVVEIRVTNSTAHAARSPTGADPLRNYYLLQKFFNLKHEFWHLEISDAELYSKFS